MLQIKYQGFTLIEVLVVIAMIGLLASIVIVNLNSARAKARDSQRIASLTNLEKGIQLYFSINGMYPCGYTYDSSNSLDTTYDSSVDCSPTKGFLMGCNHYSPPDICDAGNFTTNPALAACLTASNGLYPTISEATCPKDPINKQVGTVYYGYGYQTSLDRKKFILYTALETDAARMQNDGGICSDLYEAGNGVGSLTPLLNAGVIGSC